MERLVGNEMVHEHAAYESRVDAWPSTYDDAAIASLTGHDALRILLQFGLGFGLLFQLLCLLVYIHERQSDVALGHDKREACHQPYAQWTEVVLQNTDGFAHGVACRAHCIAVDRKSTRLNSSHA